MIPALLPVKKIVFASLLWMFGCCTVLAQGTSKLDSLQQRLANTASDTARLNLLVNISELSWRSGKHEGAIEHAKQAIDLATKLESNKQLSVTAKIAKARAYNSIGSVAREKGDYDSALVQHYKAAEIGETINATSPNDSLNLRTLAVSYNNIGGIRYFTGNYDKALEAYLQTLQLFERIKDKPRIASTLNNIGLIHEGKKDYKKALEYYGKSLDQQRLLGNKKGMASCLNNIGNVYAGKMQNDSALLYYEKAVKLNIEIGNRNWLAFNYENIGSIYTRKQDFAKALSYHLQALEIRKELNEIRGMCSSYRSIGELYFRQKNYSEAEKNALLAVETAKQLGARPEMADAYLTLAQCDSATGDFRSAFVHHRLYASVKDSILNEESSRQIAEMQTRFETEKKETENKLLLNENKINALEINRQKANRNMLIIGFSLLLLAGLFFFNRSRLINRNKMLQEKDLRNKAVFKAQEQEKGRLSKELHDGLGPLLSLIKLNASGIPADPKSEKMLHEIKELASEGMKEVRTIAHALMPSLLQKGGLKAALQEFIAQVKQSGLVDVNLVYTINEKLDNEAEVNIYRIVQEAMNNAIKHGNASGILVELTAAANSIHLVIEDNGKGFDAAAVKKGNGLDNMVWRAEVLKGSVQVESKPGKGTRIDITLPQTLFSNA
jgi:signal transduction histidine kinase